jgi:hypothetical protein
MLKFFFDRLDFTLISQDEKLDPSDFMQKKNTIIKRRDLLPIVEILPARQWILIRTDMHPTKLWKMPK